MRGPSPAPSWLPRSGTALAAALVVMAGAGSARAVEHEQHLGLDLGGSMLVIGGQSSPEVGGTFGAHWAYGLGDAGNLMVEGAWSLVSAGQSVSDTTPPTRPSWVGNLDVGACYVFDVLQWVPYAGALVGGYALSGGTLPDTKFEPGLALAAGVDYRFSPSLAAGVGLREHFLVDMSTYPSFTQAFARVEVTWGAW